MRSNFVVTFPNGIKSKLTNITRTLYDFMTLINIVYVCNVTVITNKSLQYPTYIGDSRRMTRLYDMTEPADETASSAVQRVVVRLPTFWPDRPAVCFAQAEAQFELAAITR
jgi:hypothetical protein